jgi:hypothetical protein
MSIDIKGGKPNLKQVTKAPKTDNKNSGLAAAKQGWKNTSVWVAGCYRNDRPDAPEYADAPQ